MPKNAEKRNDAPVTRGQHARRFARVGMFIGAVVGLGGGIGGVLKMALLGALGGAVAGGVAGEKLSPLADKIASFLPGKRKKQAQAVSAPVQQKLQEKVQAKPAPEMAQYQDLGSIDPQVLAELRDGVSGAVTKLKAASIAEAGMLKEGEVAQNGGWVDAVSNKRPTHPAHLTYQ
ncbi:MAG: hypothetical protein FJX23_08820 [Alphaproteobacteria bacterium]|nr:hypothetical protein [Alphaproteobacteria bacterium]